MLRTPNLQLPQWETNDVISYLGEWNSAMDKIDDGFASIQAVANSAGSTASTAGTNATNALNLANDLADDVAALQSTATTQGNTINSHTTQIGALNTNVSGITAKIGTTDISDMGDGTITGALQSLSGDESVVLWTNPSPTSSFAGQTVTLSETIANFQFYEIKYAGSPSTPQAIMSTGKIPIQNRTILSIATLNAQYRSLNSAPSGTSVVFEDNFNIAYTTGTQTTLNTGLIPIQIIGYK